MKFESTLIPPPDAERVRRVVIELPASRAEALAETLDSKIVWDTTEVEDELGALYQALRYDS